jgi:dihydrofolate reductase
MAKVILYIAASLDGYIARANGDIDWLSSVERPGEDYGYAAFYSSLDALVMGRETYDLSLTFGEWPYPGKKSFVFTHRNLKSVRQDVAFLSSDVVNGVAAIEAQGFHSLWLVGGGALTRSFFQNDLIDEYIISIIPVLLGSGIPLFPPAGREQKLVLAKSTEYPSGLVQLQYKRHRAA